MEIKETTNIENNLDKIYLDGKEITLIELQTARQNPNVKISLKEGSTNQYVTKQRLFG